MEEDLDRNRRKRVLVRASMSKVIIDMDRLLAKDNNINDELENLVELLNVKDSVLKELDKVIEFQVPLDELETEVVSAMEYQDKVTSVRCQARRRLQAGSTSRTVDTQSSTETLVNARPEKTVRLPKIVLGKFYGDSGSWQEFWNQFESAIHSNDTITKTDKFNYLKSLLGGRAANAVSGLSLSSENYDVAVHLLMNRFGRKDLVISAHMNKILNADPVKVISDVAALRKLYDLCEVQIRSLESLGVTSGTYGNLLCPILLKLVPEEMVLEFTRERNGSGEWDIKQLIDFMKKEVECREAVHMMKSDGNLQRLKPLIKSNEYKNERERPIERAKFHTRNKPTGASLATTVNKKCMFCNGTQHESEACQNSTVEERRERVKNEGRCFVCLRNNHISRWCRSKLRCALCQGKHNKAICYKIIEEITDADTVISSVSTGGKELETKPKKVFLQTCSAMVYESFKSKIVRCLLDTGSQRSFISYEIARYLKLPFIRKETLSICAFGVKEPEENAYDVVELKLKNTKYQNKCFKIEALVTDRICAANISAPDENIKNLAQLKRLQLADCYSGATREPISVLIGADYYWNIVTGKIQRLSDSLVAVETVFGWCVQGHLGSADTTKYTAMEVIVEETQSVSKELKLFWELEALGIREPDEKPMLCDKEAMEHFNKEIRLVNGRYEVKLPWKTNREELQPNVRNAERRFFSLTKKLKLNKELQEEYAWNIQMQLNEGIIEKCSSNLNVQGVYYMPHHAVVKKDKSTTKVRIVFDASSKENNSVSLNDCLLTGPNLNPDLLTVMLMFRRHKVAFCADIEKAFLQISLSESDRDYLRFFWTTSFSNQSKIDELDVFRMTRVPFGVRSSPFLLSATIRHHIKNYITENSEVCEMLNDNLYVDDLVHGSDTVEKACLLSLGATEILGMANMKLRKFRTNSEQLKEQWRKNNVDESKDGLPSKILGIYWNNIEDTLNLNLEEVLENLKEGRRCTKRNVLKLVSKIYDPIGFVSPFVIKFKCLLQEIWERGLQWDEELPRETKSKWKQYCLEFEDLRKLSVPQAYFGKNISFNNAAVELHVFTDASIRAYGAVAYFRCKSLTCFEVSFVMSKTRVAPLNRLTLPRLELMGALIGARLTHYLKGAFQLSSENIFLWSDSQITLYWIKGSAGNWKPFVSNRVEEIQRLIDPKTWRYCKGKDNPADLLTRGERGNKLIIEKQWWEGPAWLLSDETEWPTCASFENGLKAAESERRKVRHNISGMPCIVNYSDAILALENFSSLQKIYRVTAWINRFVNNLKHNNVKRIGALSLNEINAAERYWIKFAQQQAFKEEIQCLHSNESICKDSQILEFNPRLDKDGLVCVGGRLQNSKFSLQERHPWLLPNGIKFCELVILAAHNIVMHSGVADTLVQVRERFWIIKGRQYVKSVLNRCLICKRYKAQPGSQIMAPLPMDRVQESVPFTVTGLDFAGPLYIKGNNNKKNYILLCTCATTRAVHLELVSDLSTETFILALRRFFARRGVVSTIYSDNAKTFKRANKELKELWEHINQNEVIEFYGAKQIRWKFIVERGAWWGGFWERMVRSVKTCLKKIVGKLTLTFDELNTVLIEIEAVLNSRPLTYVYNEVEEPFPLTPSHFLVGARLTSLPSAESCASAPLTHDQMNKKYRHRQRLLDLYWSRWRREYLLCLKSANSVKHKRNSKSYAIGDIVLLGDNKVPRNMWRMGKITEVYYGTDGNIRACALKTASGVLKRPIQLLYSLELNCDDERQFIGVEDVAK